MILDQDNSLLLIIDIQEKLLKAVFNKELLEKKSKILVEACSKLDVPMYTTEQYPQGLGETIEPLRKSDYVFIKTAFNALDDEKLLNAIKDSGKKQIVVIGIETHICVYQTVLDLIERGHNVYVVCDCCASRSELNYKTSLELMKQLGARITTLEMVLFEFLKSSKHEHFKQIQALIK